MEGFDPCMRQPNPEIHWGVLDGQGDRRAFRIRAEKANKFDSGTLFT